MTVPQRARDVMDPERRRELGAHYTPPAMAARLVELAFEVARAGTGGSGGTTTASPGRSAPLVCDPSCGNGSVLLAAADALVSDGVEPSAVLSGHLVGFELDAASASQARRALREWAAAHGVDPAPIPWIIRADALGLPVNAPVFDVVVGNPPFASPLTAGITRLRGVDGGGTYLDTSAVHLLAAVRATRPGGVTCLVQPQSLLGARDSGGLRENLDALAVLEALWASDADLFEHATVRVCAPVLRRRVGAAAADDGSPGGDVARGAVTTVWREDVTGRVQDPGPAAWASLLASMSGAPIIDEPPATVAVSTVARCTAGFRDEFYALADVVHEAPEDTDCGFPPRTSGAYPDHVLVSSGMIDPGVLRWGDGDWRIAGVSYRRPVADAASLPARNAKVAAWARNRRVAKVMVASQTKVIEVVADPQGRCVPLTPVVSVEPGADWRPAVLAAMLSAPSNSALMWSRAAGTGRSTSALRISARGLGECLVDPDPRSWRAAEELWSQMERMADLGADEDQWADLGVLLDRTVGFPGEPGVARWWAERLPRRMVSA